MAVSFFQTLQSFSQFAMNFVLSGGKLVDQNTANLRAEICAACTNNKSAGDIRKSCTSCNKMANQVVNKFRYSVLGSNKTTSDSKLLACGICGCDLKISVWIPNATLLSKGDANAYPTYCWKKSILEDRDL